MARADQPFRPKATTPFSTSVRIEEEEEEHFIFELIINNGAMKHSVAALVWLKDNVAGFGGDATRMTLIGHATGASLVNLLMISPLASGRTQET